MAAWSALVSVGTTASAHSTVCGRETLSDSGLGSACLCSTVLYDLRIAQRSYPLRPQFAIVTINHPRFRSQNTMAHHLGTLLAFYASLTAASMPRPLHHTTQTAADIMTALNLTANPEKGYYAQTFVDSLNVTYTATTAVANRTGTEYMTTRAASTAIYYLLEGAAGDSYWHRHDGLEVWHYYAGAPLRLRTAWDDGSPVSGLVLGADVVGEAGQRPQGFVDRWQWQSARSLGDWTLVGTTGECIPCCQTRGKTSPLSCSICQPY